MNRVNSHQANNNEYTSSRHDRIEKTLLFMAFIFFAFNLRAHITSVPSVVEVIKTDLQISSQTAGLLSSVPVLCFGVMMPFMSWIASKLGINRALILTLIAIAIGVLVRSHSSVWLVFSGTLIMGSAATLGNLLSLMIIARDFKKYADVITSVYVVAMSVGATFTAGMTAPIAAQLGWQMALSIWTIFAFVAIALWLMVFKLRKAKEGQQAASINLDHSSSEQQFVPAWKKLNVWLIALCFASHTFMFYSLTAWFPSYLQEVAEMSLEKAGSIASIFQIAGIIGCVLVPWLNRTGKFSRLMLFAVVAGSWFLLVIGILIAPSLWSIWLVFGGIASGGGFLVIFMLVMDLSPTMDENRSNSAFVQGIGYVCASTGPAVVGYIHEYTASWVQSLSLLPCIALMMFAMGIVATKKVGKPIIVLQSDVS